VAKSIQTSPKHQRAESEEWWKWFFCQAEVQDGSKAAVEANGTSAFTSRIMRSAGFEGKSLNKNRLPFLCPVAGWVGSGWY
jgi:hypothetical protein